MSHAQVGRYLANILHLLRHTPVYLERAREQALQRGWHELAEYFAHKLDEEVGHDQWAVSDLANFKSQLRVESPSETMPAMAQLLEQVASIIDEDPTLYLAYILFAEYFTVLEGPEWLALLEECCGVPREYMTAILNHAELDKDHVHEGLDAIDALVGDPAYLSSMRDALRRSIVCFDAFLQEVARSSEGTEDREVYAA